MSDVMEKEWRIGEIRQIDGEWYQCVRSITCNYCGFNDNGCTADKHLTGDCSGRLDGTSVIFRKLDKVGEPFELNGKLYQQIIPFNVLCEGCSFYDAQSRECKIRYTDIDCDGIFVEIKENKEDMGDNDIKPYDKFFSEGTVSNTEHLSKSNLKPFDLQKAKEGKPVCTRNGRKARIICFDAKGILPIVALVESGDEEKTVRYSDSGRFRFDGTTDEEDLMMSSEKKSGWMNVYKERIYDTKEGAIKAKYNGATYIDTIEISWEE